jgi:hypothetical protein
LKGLVDKNVGFPALSPSERCLEFVMLSVGGRFSQLMDGQWVNTSEELVRQKMT